MFKESDFKSSYAIRSSAGDKIIPEISTTYLWDKMHDSSIFY